MTQTTAPPSLEIVLIERPDQLWSRENFHEEVHVGHDQLEQLIGYYVFRDKIQCGLAHCRTPHYQGFLAVLKGGKETNIGNICGAKHFGGDFRLLRKQLNRHRSRLEKLNRVRELLDTMPEIQRVVDGLDPRVRRLGQMIRTLRREWPDDVVRTLLDMAKRGSGELVVARRSKKQTDDDDSEIERMFRQSSASERLAGRSGDSPSYITRTVGRLEGFEIFTDKNSLTSVYRDAITRPFEELKAIEAADVELLTKKTLDRLAEWASSFDRIVGEAESVLAAGDRFFQRRNLDQLLKLDLPRPVRDDLRGKLKRYERPIIKPLDSP